MKPNPTHKDDIGEILSPIFKQYYKQPKYFPDEFVDEAKKKLQAYIKNTILDQQFTRLEIIDYTQETPRTVIHERDDGKVSTVSIQDDGQTLKVFVKAISLPTKGKDK